MNSYTLDPTLETRLTRVAASLGRSPAALVAEAVAAHLDALDQAKLHRERAAWEHMAPDLQEKYPGKYVAIHEGEVVDSDPRFEPLCHRVRQRFGGVAVLIRRVGEAPTEPRESRIPRPDTADYTATYCCEYQRYP